jgi:3'(2'), 5'-bisphosphate nucleotidase
MDQQLLAGFLERVGITNVVPHGSSLKICAVADGTADIYPRFGPTCLWDIAAGAP